MGKKGFTLIELVTVVGIIMVLASLILPAAGRARERARKTSCISNLRQIGIGLEIFIADNKNMYPACASLKSDNPEGLPTIVEVLSPYFGSEGVFICPSDKTYHKTEDTSYIWNRFLNGVSYDTAGIYVITGGRNFMPVMFDMESFHGAPGAPASRNFLYPDGRVGNYRGGWDE